MTDMLRQQQATLTITPHGRGMVNITRELTTLLGGSSITKGIMHLFVQHTSCSLLVQENADPEVQSDLERFLCRLIPDGDPLFKHTAEGPDDMPAHVRAALTATSLSIPIIDGRMALGTWQGVYLYEHRQAATRRRVVVHICGM